MREQRRFRRLGFASAAISAGAFALVVGVASPADASTSANCVPGHDAASALKYLQCLANNIQNGVNKFLHPTTAAPTKTSTPKATAKKTPAGVKHSKAAAPVRKANSAPARVTLPSGGTQPLAAPGQVVPVAGQPPQVGGFVPQLPQVAGSGAQAATEETHLIAPVAATTADAPARIGEPVPVAAAAGLAGIVAALNISIATRRLRRRS